MATAADVGRKTKPETAAFSNIARRETLKALHEVKRRKADNNFMVNFKM